MLSEDASTNDGEPAARVASRATYAAFVSYRHSPVDSECATWIADALERYRTPRPLTSLGYPAKLGKLFRDDDEAGADGHLKRQIVQALEDSAWLILVVSPRAFDSDWIRLELLEFARTHPVRRILPLTIEGDPELARRLVVEVLGPDAAAELPLGADLRPTHNEGVSVRRRKTLIRFAAAILGCQYDDLVRRDAQRTLRRMRIWYASAASVVAFGVVGTFLWWDFNVRVKTHWYRQVDERWGTPVGRGELSETEARHRRTSYRCRATKNLIFEVARVNGRGFPLADSQFEPFEDPGAANVARWSYRYADNALPAVIEQFDEQDVLIRRVGLQMLPDRTSAIARFERSFGIAQRDAANSGSLDTLFRADATARSHIGQHRLHFDEAGRLLRRDFEPVGGGPVIADALGAFGRLYGYDEAGRMVTMSTVGPDGTRLAGVVGQPVAVRATWRDEEVVQVGWVDRDDRPARNAGGIAGVRIERDDWGNMIAETFLDTGGRPVMSDRWKYVTKRYAYDDLGGAVSVAVEGMDGNQALVYGTHRERYVLDAHGRKREIRFFDFLDRPTPSGRTGCATLTRQWDERGFLVAWDCLDVAGRPFPDRDSGAAGMRWKHDAEGRAVETSNLGTDGRPSGGKNGIATSRREFDSSGNLLRWTGFDVDDRPAAQSDNGFAEIRYRYDAAGNGVELAGYWRDGSLASNPTEHWSVRTEDYDERGNVVARRWFDRRRQRTINAAVAASSQRIRYFDDGSVRSSSVFGPNDEPVVGKRCHRREYVRDAAGRVLESRCFDTVGRPALDLEDGGHLVRFEYGPMGWTRRSVHGVTGEPILAGDDKVSTIVRELDTEGRATLKRYFGVHGEEIVDAEEGVHAVRVVLDAAGNTIERMTYDVGMRPSAAKDDNAAWIVARFDAAGNQVETRYFGHDRLPVRNRQFGAHVMRSTYDALGQETETTFFDEQDRPIRCSDDGAHRIRQAYDAYGGVIEEAYFDESDRRSEASDSGVAIKRWERTPSGSKLREAYFGVDGKPALNRQNGVHAWVRDLDANGNLVRLRNIDVAGRIMTDRLSGVAESRRRYDRYDRVIERSFFDTEGQPATSRVDAVSRWSYGYDERGRQRLAVSFDVSGKPAIAKGRKCAAMLSEYGAQDEPRPPRCVSDWAARLSASGADVAAAEPPIAPDR